MENDVFSLYLQDFESYVNKNFSLFNKFFSLLKGYSIKFKLTDFRYVYLLNFSENKVTLTRDDMSSFDVLFEMSWDLSAQINQH